LVTVVVVGGNAADAEVVGWPLPNQQEFKAKMNSLPSTTLHKGQHFQLDVGEQDWYDLWHLHLDMEGEGNASEEKHREFITAHLELFRRLQTQAANFSKPWQSWIVIDPSDSSQDAVYFHTPNPNHDNFPYTFETVLWNIATPDLLAGLTDEKDLAVGQSDYNGFRIYWIKNRQIDL
jgi:hypothetical protein